MNFLGGGTSLVLIGMIWGITNPFIKNGAQGVEKIKCSTRIKQIFSEILYLSTKLQFVLPFIINQSGSLLYYFVLKDSDLSIAVPVVNSLAFLFTGLTGWALKETPPNKGSIMGMALMLTGVLCYLIDKPK